MSGGGFISGVNTSLKNNKLLRNKRKFKDSKGRVLYSPESTELEFKNVSKNELERLKASIRKKAEKRKRKERLAIIVLAALIVSILLYML